MDLFCSEAKPNNPTDKITTVISTSIRPKADSFFKGIYNQATNFYTVTLVSIAKIDNLRIFWGKLAYSCGNIAFIWGLSLVSFSVIILAAGQGTRMRSVKPKVLQLLAGKPLLHHVLDTVNSLAPDQTIVVCGHQGGLLQQSCANYSVDWVWQTEQLGTGHAVKTAYPSLVNNSRVLVLCGDVPLIKSDTLQKLLDNTPENSLGILTVELANPYGLGRIIRDANNNVISIVEEKDATDAQRAINEINTGIYVLPYKYLSAWLNDLTNNNNQQEYYLTDIIALAVKSNVSIVSYTVTNEIEVYGVNSQIQLAEIERDLQFNTAMQLMAEGVKIYDPSRLDIRGTVLTGKDVVIDVNVILEGQVTLGDNVVIGSNVVIKNCTIGSGTIIKANSVLESAVIDTDCEVGPFARVRPGTHLTNKSKIGNFVEVKNSTIGHNSKVNHLSYIGDAELGHNVNVGAGVITCNYDGAAKHKTIIEDDVFIGSNCELIAPVTVGKGATLAAGTTLTKDAPAGALTLNKKIMTSILAWQRPAKHKEEV